MINVTRITHRPQIAWEERKAATTEALRREEAAKKLPAYLVKEYGDHVFIVRAGQTTIIIND